MPSVPVKVSNYRNDPEMIRLMIEASVVDRLANEHGVNRRVALCILDGLSCKDDAEVLYQEALKRWRGRK